MSLREDLIAAKALIADPAKWVKGDAGDLLTCWCAATACKAIALTYGLHMQKHWGRMTSGLERSMPPSFRPISLPDYNDTPGITHADIMALFDRAIAKATPSPSEALGG